MARKLELFISVDIEADGPIPGLYSMASIGACVVGDLSQTFYVELKPISENFDPKAVEIMAEGGISREQLLTEGVEAAEAMRRFNAWIEEVCSNQYRPVFVAYNATFDWMFVYWYFMNFLGIKPFGISGLDIKAYMMGLMRFPEWRDTVASKVPQEFRSNREHTHNALDDALGQAEMFQKMLEFAAAQA